MSGRKLGLFSLAPPEERKPSRLLTNRNFCLENDADYLCDLLFRKGLVAGLIVIAALLLDLQFKTNFLIDAAAFSRNKLLLPLAFTHTVRWGALLAGLWVYARIRTSINIREDHVPILIHKQLLLGRSRTAWIRSAILITLGGLIAIFGSHFFVWQIVLHFHRQDSLGFIVMVMLMSQVFCPGTGFGIAAGLLLGEKAVRFFPQLQRDLISIAQYRSII